MNEQKIIYYFYDQLFDLDYFPEKIIYENIPIIKIGKKWKEDFIISVLQK